MNKLSFQQKLWVPLICSLLCITAIFLYETIQARNVRIEERSNDLRNIDDAGLSILKLFGDRAAAGTLSKEEAQKQAMAVIKGLRNDFTEATAGSGHRGGHAARKPL